MQLADYEKGLLVAACWRLAVSNDVNELVAIGCTIRNWVVPSASLSLPDGRKYFGSYSEAIESFLDSYPGRVRGLPSLREPALVDPTEGLLMVVDRIYDCTHLDITASREFPTGARYFERPGYAKPGIAGLQLIGTFGGQQFYV